MTKPKTVTCRVLCTGTAILSGWKKGNGIQRLDDNNVPVGERCYFTKLKSVYPGLVYEGEFVLDEGGGIQQIQGGLKWIGNFEDEKLSGIIKLESRAADTVLAVRGQERKARTSNEDIFACLEPLRKAYRNTNHEGRLAIEVRVLDYMRRQE